MAKEAKKVERVSFTLPTGTKVTGSKETVDKLKGASATSSKSSK